MPANTNAQHGTPQSPDARVVPESGGKDGRADVGTLTDRGHWITTGSRKLPVDVLGLRSLDPCTRCLRRGALAKKRCSYRPL